VEVAIGQDQGGYEDDDGLFGRSPYLLDFGMNVTKFE
jgi:hypothetical protein